MAKRIGNIRKPLPVVALRGTVVFPGTVTPIVIGRSRTIEALEFASHEGRKIFLVAQKDPAEEEPRTDDLFRVGTIARVIQVMRFPSGMLKALVEGEIRADVVKYNNVRNFMEAIVEPFIPTVPKDAPETTALLRKSKELFAQYVKLSHNMPEDLAKLLDRNPDANAVADVISAQLTIDFRPKQQLLEAKSINAQLIHLTDILAREVNVLKYREEIEHKVQKLMEDGQKEYFLRQQLEVIRGELGEEGAWDEELQELEKEIKNSSVPDTVRNLLQKEFQKLSRTPFSSPEATVTRTYIEWLMELPWSAITPDTTDIGKAEQILEEDHYGLEKIKERILEHIAVMSLSQSSRGPILCFVGPPGVGKTSVARSVARALGRKFVRASLGGLHDEAEIRGHRRTYVSALPGKIIQGVRRAGAKNPVFLLDEVDKIGHDFRGDPAAALMEVLDPDQNGTFMDNYIELPFDLSKVLFITTANTVEGIPPPLLDRMEILRIPGYLESEKFQIAQNYLLPKQLDLVDALKIRDIAFASDAYLTIIQEYTREAGVRELERQISAVLRKVAVQVSKGNVKNLKIDSKKAREFLGVPKFVDSPIPKKLIPGESLGLAWTSAGGELLRIEVLLLEGKGRTKFTGSLGDVMKESIEAALSVVRSRAKKFGFDAKKMEKCDIHIHFPEGAVPKDGPSAGVAIVFALASALMKKSLPNDIAMTGEITLSGRVLPIGGLPEKLLAARRFGIKRIIIPESNKKDLAEIKPDILKGLKLITVATIDEAMQKVFSK